MRIPIQFWSCTCEKCGNFWVSRSENIPKLCPSCKSVNWDTQQTNPPSVIPKIESIAMPVVQSSEPEFLDDDEDDEPEEDWRFTTKDKPQYADDGNVYRKQVLWQVGKQFRTVKVDEDDHDNILEVL